MKSLRTVWLGLAIAGALLAGTAAMAQGPGGGMGMGPGGMRPCPGFGQHQPPMERALGLGGDQGRWWNRPKVIERLKLTVDQRKAMDGILLAHREKLIDLRASVERVELEMEPLISADQPDEARILSQIDKVAQARAERKGECALSAGDPQQADARAVEAGAGVPRRPRTGASRLARWTRTERAWTRWRESGRPGSSTEPTTGS